MYSYAEILIKSLKMSISGGRGVLSRNPLKYGPDYRFIYARGLVGLVAF